MTARESSVPGASGDSSSQDEARRHFRRTLVRVMAVQIVTLLLLWLLQARYTG